MIITTEQVEKWHREMPAGYSTREELARIYPEFPELRRGFGYPHHEERLEKNAYFFS